MSYKWDLKGAHPPGVFGYVLAGEGWRGRGEGGGEGGCFGGVDLWNVD